MMDAKQSETTTSSKERGLRQGSASRRFLWGTVLLGYILSIILFGSNWLAWNGPEVCAAFGIPSNPFLLGVVSWTYIWPLLAIELMIPVGPSHGTIISEMLKNVRNLGVRLLNADRQVPYYLSGLIAIIIITVLTSSP